MSAVSDPGSRPEPSPGHQLLEAGVDPATSVSLVWGETDIISNDDHGGNGGRTQRQRDSERPPLSAVRRVRPDKPAAGGVDGAPCAPRSRPRKSLTQWHS